MFRDARARGKKHPTFDPTKQGTVAAVCSKLRIACARRSLCCACVRSKKAGRRMRAHESSRRRSGDKRERRRSPLGILSRKEGARFARPRKGHRGGGLHTSSKWGPKPKKTKIVPLRLHHTDTVLFSFFLCACPDTARPAKERENQKKGCKKNVLQPRPLAGAFPSL